VKRGEGCTSLNGPTTFNAGGAVFDIFCGMTWAYYDALNTMGLAALLDATGIAHLTWNL